MELLNQYAKQQMEQFFMDAKNNNYSTPPPPTSTSQQGQTQTQQAVSYSTSSSNNIPNPEKLQKLMDESEKEYAREQKNCLNLEEFLKYEQQAILRNNNNNQGTSYIDMDIV